MKKLLFVALILAACSKDPMAVPAHVGAPVSVSPASAAEKLVDAAPALVPDAAVVAPVGSAPAPEPEIGDWQYETQKDGMGDAIWMAKLVSATMARLHKPPYNGAWDVTITVSRVNDESPQVLISVEEGQFDCSAYNECTIRVSVGSASPKMFQFKMLKSKKFSNILMVQNPDAFLKSLRDASGFKIELPFFREEKTPVVGFLQNDDVKLP